MEIIPHRDPMLLIDEATEFVPGERIVSKFLVGLLYTSLIHVMFHDAGQCGVVLVAALPALEEDIGVDGGRCV